MEKVVIKVARTDNGYSAACDLLSGWVVASTGDFGQLNEYVIESLDFYLECAKKDGDQYPAVFDGEYELVYEFDVQSLLCYYQNIFSFSALQFITGINQKQLSHYAAGRSKPRKEQATKIVDGLHKLGNELMLVSV